MHRMLAAAGIPRDAAIMVHSAFKGLARDGYSADSVLEALIEYFEPGTLLLPTMSWRYVKPQSPVFDELETPSNTGILTELFRTRYAERRSLHPTHSVAGRGRWAEEILGAHHQCVTPCATQSPFGRLADHDGHVVMLAVGMDCCTLIHHVEELVAPDLYCRPPEDTETYRCRARDGREEVVHLRRHKFLPRDYWQFQDVLAARGQLTAYRCDNSIALAFQAPNMRRAVKEVLEARPDAIIAKPGQRYRLM